MKYMIALLLLLTSASAATGDIDVTAKFVLRDFSTLLIPKSESLGFIGANYQRLRIHIASISQDKKVPALYHVKGTSEVKAIRCDFEGTLTVKSITKLQTINMDADEEFEPKGLITAEGVFTASYELRENPRQKNAGVFAGVMTLTYIERKGALLVDDSGGDAYRNNQYAGTWTAYGTAAKGKAANWGEFRIPDSGDLDIGDGEFQANAKYKAQGW